MKKTNLNIKNLRNNKGIALISILIAVAFISIIGSALLYITYSNFQMKVMNNRSKTNYYETDGELVNATAALRSYCDNPTKADTVVTVDPNDSNKYVYNVINAMHYAGIDNGVDGNPADLTWHDPVTGDEYHINPSGVAERTENGNLTTYVLKDFSVSQKSKNDGRGSYYNKVKTDVELKILKQTSGGSSSQGLGECSVIADSLVTVDDGYGNGQNTAFSFLTLFGDSYFSYYYHGEGATAQPSDFKTFDGAGTYTQPGEYKNASKSKSKEAFYIAGNTKVNFEGNFMAVYGDLVLDKNSVLNITKGNLTVYGDIYLLQNSTLICNGTIYQPSDILPGRTERCGFKKSAGAGPGTMCDDAYLKSHLYYPAGQGKSAPYKAQEVSKDSFKSICTLMNLNDTNADNDGISKKIVKSISYDNGGTPVTIEHPLDSIVNNPVKIKTSSGEVSTISTDYYGQKCGVAFVVAGAQVGNIDEWANYILFVTGANDTTRRFDLKGSSIKTTVVSASPIYINVQAGVYFSKMGSDVYDYLTIGKDETNNPYYKADVHKWDVGLSYGYQKPDGSWVNFNPNWGQNYYGAKDFLDDQTNTHIQNLFSYGINGGGGVDTYINSVSFKGYVKDVE